MPNDASYQGEKLQSGTLSLAYSEMFQLASDFRGGHVPGIAVVWERVVLMVKLRAFHHLSWNRVQVKADPSVYLPYMDSVPRLQPLSSFECESGVRLSVRWKLAMRIALGRQQKLVICLVAPFFQIAKSLAISKQTTISAFVCV